MTQILEATRHGAIGADRAREIIREEAAAAAALISGVEAVVIGTMEAGVDVDTEHLVLEVAARSPHPGRICLHNARDPERGLSVAGTYLFWRLAAARAVLSLLNRGELLPMDVPAKLGVLRFGYTTAAEEGGSGGSGSLDFPEVAVCLPRFVRRAV